MYSIGESKKEQSSKQEDQNEPAAGLLADALDAALAVAGVIAVGAAAA